MPQTLVDTVGNILAACVDSNNTSTTTSTQCSTLFANATLDGKTTGTKPTDIAAAAFNIAHFPYGTNNTNFVTNLYGIPSGNVPFVPNLATKPNDFTLGIQYRVNSSSGNSDTLLNSPQILTIDGQPYAGNEYGTNSPQNAIWIGSYSAQAAKLFTTGAPDYTTNASTNFAATRDARSLAMDNSGNVWILEELVNDLKEFSDTGTLLQTITLPGTQAPQNEGVSAAIDASGNLFVDEQGSILKYTSGGVNIPYTGGGANAVWSVNNSCLEDSANKTLNYTYYVVLDSNGILYAIDYPGDKLCVVNPTTAATNHTISGYTAYLGDSAIPFTSVDANNTVWSTNPGSNELIGYNSTLNATAIEYTYTGGGLNAPASTAIDGAGNIWVTNTGNSSLSEFTASGTALSPTTGFGALGLNSPNSAGVVIDRAGDVWAVYSAEANYIVELIGLAQPAVSPTSFATFNHLIGTRPH